jgi:hypothetical protein
VSETFPPVRAAFTTVDKIQACHFSVFKGVQKYDIKKNNWQS